MDPDQIHANPDPQHCSRQDTKKIIYIRPLHPDAILNILYNVPRKAQQLNSQHVADPSGIPHARPPFTISTAAIIWSSECVLALFLELEAILIQVQFIL